MKKRHIIPLAALLLAGFAAQPKAQAQDLVPATPDTVRLSVQQYLTNHGVDTAMVGDTTAFRLRLVNLKTNYAQRADTCQKYSDLLTKAYNGLRRSGTLRDGVLWIDAFSCYSDYGYYAPRLEACAQTARSMEAHYRELERQRVAEEKRLAEEKALRDAQQRQDELDAQLQQVKARVNDQHLQIEALCSGNGVNDKKKQKALVTIASDYRIIFYRYDLNTTQGDPEMIERLERLERFQRHLIDSVLGPNGYPNLIEDFPNTLKIRAGKAHGEVYKSYTRAFKQVIIPKSFGRLEDYHSYIARLRDVMAVQSGYTEAIALREEIASNSVALQKRCAKKRRNMYDAYETVLSGLNQVPAFITVGEKDMFLESLRQFIEVQGQYMTSVDRLDAIDLRSDSLLNLCSKKTADVATAYKELANSVKGSFIPTFKTISGADFYMSNLNDFEQLQADYIETIGLRNTILQKNDSILGCKGAPKLLTAGYKEHFGRTYFTPAFNNHEKAEEYLQTLYDFVDAQNAYLRSEALTQTMAANEASIKATGKNAPNISKAYGKIVKELDDISTIHSLNDLQRYVNYQQSVIALQERVLELMHSPDFESFNQKLKGVKNINEMKGILGIYN